MGETYRAFGSCILFKEVHSDDLGRFYRAGLIDGTSLGRTVWLRVLDEDGLSAEKITGAFENARLIAETLQSAQLPSDPLFIEAGGIPALGGDHVAGQPLNRVLAQARDEAFPMQPDNALLITEKIALALTAGMAVDVGGQALNHGFLHPGLIVLSNDGEAQVAGFGLGEALLDALETSGAVAGGLAYLAPEVVENRTPSKSGDVYSLGAILFHLLTGTALPASPNDRGAALEAAMLAYDGEPLPDDIRSILTRSLAPSPGNRFSSAAEFKTELDHLIYGGNYSPTTFNLALFMDRLFRSDIEADEASLEDEHGVDVSTYLELEPEPEPELEAVEPVEPQRDNRILWAAIAAAVVVVAAIGIFWGTGGFGPPQPPPVPTPTAAEIEARRQAQEDRLKTLTQEMVQEMMAERETEIREELIGRQQRIEELQQRLYRSERRAKQNAAAAADEAKTQRELKEKIEQEEKAKREQEEALQAEIENPVDTPKAVVAAPGTGAAAATGTATGASGQNGGEAPKPQAKKPTPIPPTPKPTAVPAPVVKYGDFVAPEKADTLPVVIKSEPLTWPRAAMSSALKGLVIVQVRVNATGGVDNVEILRADHRKFGIPEAALEAAAGYRFKPGTKNRVAITTNTFITWRYDFTD